MDKQGIVFTRPRDTVSFFVGLVLVVFGALPIVVRMGWLGLGLPSFMMELPVQIAIWIVAVAGLYVVIDGFIEPPAHNLHWFLIGAGLILFVVGLVPILNQFSVIGFTLGIKNTLIYQIIITVEGALLLVGGLTEH
ncbi:hypothetical protein GOV11_02310 [Candidatus Woesearchaeota archaeon]|nr:hypothetical protein [Candidatus Woesearchaeota archaeon]